MATRRRDMEDTTGIGSRVWIVRGVAAVCAALIVFLLGGTMRRIDRLEDKLDGLKDRVLKLEAGHTHPTDPAIGDLKDRVRRLENPWSSRAQPRRETP